MPAEWTHRTLTHAVTWWKVSSSDEYGKPTYTSPCTIKGRWRDVSKHFQAADGETKVSKAEVWVDRAIAPGDWLARGASTAADPATVTGAGRVQAYRETWGLRDDAAERVAVL